MGPGSKGLQQGRVSMINKGSSSQRVDDKDFDDNYLGSFTRTDGSFIVFIVVRR